jgi:CBS domain containing-hemolysin-like protein
MLLRAAQEEHDVLLESIAREILVVRETLPLPDLLERLLDRLEHIALVVDEYGGVAGVVSMEDVVETLLGLEIVDEADSVEDMQALARQQWFKRARELGMVSEEAYEKVSARAQKESSDGSAIPDLPSKEELAEGEALSPPPPDSAPESAPKSEQD